MRHVYAMHMYFLANADIWEIWTFYDTHRSGKDKNDWAMHMLRVQEALRSSKGQDLKESDEALTGTVLDPIEFGSARDVSKYMKYYVMHDSFVDTKLFMQKAAAVQKNLHCADARERIELRHEDSVLAETWWTQGQIAPLGLIDKLHEALERGENAVDARLTWDGKIMSVTTAQELVNRAYREYTTVVSSAAKKITRPKLSRTCKRSVPARTDYQTRG